MRPRDGGSSSSNGLVFIDPSITVIVFIAIVVKGGVGVGPGRRLVVIRVEDAVAHDGVYAMCSEGIRWGDQRSGE